MIKTTNTLACKFRDSLGKSRGMNIDNPIEGLTPEKVGVFMNTLIEKNIIMPDIEDSDLHYAIMAVATITTKVVEDIQFT